MTKAACHQSDRFRFKPSGFSRLLKNPHAYGASNTAEFAPDNTIEQRNGFTSTWRFGGNGDLSMVCLYDGSATFYRARLHPLPAGCTARNDDGLTQAWCETR